ncbi:glycosyltransferase family 2 protein [Thalassobellus citreus]|uniref:glycosyltransferase family 2 protein n=1 Tax=Thalassobellus citreus TaxID=3367752 RepID=UPI0037A48EAC
MKPEISILIPIYNSSLQLERCLHSVINQSFKNFEVIMINDGSTDNSEKICLNYSSLDSRFKYYKKENGKKATAVNFGYKMAVGNFISIIDSDDFIEHNLYEIALATILKHNVDIVNYSFNYIKNGKKEKNSLPFIKNKIITNTHFREVLKSHMHNKKMLLWFSWSNLMRKSLLDEFNIRHDETQKIGADSTFNLECYLNANGIYSIKDCLYNYVYNNNSMTQIKYKPNLLKNLEKQFDARKTIYKKYNLIDIDYKKDFSSYYMEHSLFFILNNEKCSPQKLKISTLSKIRKSEIYKYALKYYSEFSENLTLKKRITIFLFKNNYLKSLYFMHLIINKKIINFNAK